MNIGISLKVTNQTGSAAPVPAQTSNLLVNNTDRLLINDSGDFLRVM